MTRLALDTNVLAYAEGLNDPERRDWAVALLRKLRPETVYVPVQVLAELFHVFVRKSAMVPAEAKSVILQWSDRYPLIETSPPVLVSALELSLHHRLRIWDAIVLSAAASAQCRLLLSEDLQQGFTWNGVTVVNPFIKPTHEVLADALRL